MAATPEAEADQTATTPIYRGESVSAGSNAGDIVHNSSLYVGDLDREVSEAQLLNVFSQARAPRLPSDTQLASPLASTQVSPHGFTFILHRTGASSVAPSCAWLVSMLPWPCAGWSSPDHSCVP